MSSSAIIPDALKEALSDLLSPHVQDAFPERNFLGLIHFQEAFSQPHVYTELKDFCSSHADGPKSSPSLYTLRLPACMLTWQPDVLLQLDFFFVVKHKTFVPKTHATLYEDTACRATLGWECSSPPQRDQGPPRCFVGRSDAHDPLESVSISKLDPDDVGHQYLASLFRDGFTHLLSQLASSPA